MQKASMQKIGVRKTGLQEAKDEEIDIESPVWTGEEIRTALSLADLPPSVQRAIQNRKRGPQKTPRKVAISIRLSADVAEGLRATGEGWQVRADEALRSWLDRTQRDSGK